MDIGEPIEIIEVERSDVDWAPVEMPAEPEPGVPGVPETEEVEVGAPER